MSGSPQLLLSLDHSGVVKEYRVTAEGKIEARLVDGGADTEKDWREVLPAQLSSHVRRNTAVARWLERTLGWRRLLWACIGEEPFRTESAAEQRDHHAA
jgi:hypothetical protein